jgi:hypothetical protein
MAEDDSRLEADGYYGEENMNDEDLDLSFLDEDEKEDKK